MPNDEAEGGATVVDRPGARVGTPADETAILERPTVADRPPRVEAEAEPTRTLAPGTAVPSLAIHSLTTAADAMRNEEVERTRLFIRMGWLISVAAIGTVPMLPGPLAMKIAMVAAMMLGIVVSFGFHQAFADPQRYSEIALVKLSVMSVVNAHVAVLYFGAFSVAPVIVVVGMHFVARTEAERAARWIFASAIACYAAIAVPIIVGMFPDPGVFATERPIDRATLSVGAAFVIGTYVLAYVTARLFRRASISSIDDLAKATRLASQREALMDELRADLERALRIGGPGRYSEQTFGSFKLAAVLGRGAMGEVYEAVHATTGDPAAVKLLRREQLADPTLVARFLREARAGGRLDSPYVVRVLEASGDDAPVPYLAMERLHGATLAELLRRDPKLAPLVVVEVVHDVGAGIDAAAAAGIVHRDLKPQNLFRTESGWKILDFGVATLSEDAGALTQGGVVGTPAYMAPEQAQGRPVDARADVYALAAVAYRCLTGRHPFAGTDTPTTLYAVVHKMPPRPGALAELPVDIDAWLAVALAKTPSDRFASGRELAGALAAALAGHLDASIRRRADGLLRKHPWEVTA